MTKDLNRFLPLGLKTKRVRRLLPYRGGKTMMTGQGGRSEEDEKRSDSGLSPEDFLVVRYEV